MNITTSAIVFFSPTATSRKVALAVSEGCEYNARVIDATYIVPSDLSFASDALVFIAVPVYGGKVAPLALQRMETLRGNGTPVVLIVVYGNRAYEGALQQLYDFVSSRGFVPIAAGAFVGEHSYSSREYPIAVGRPDIDDLSVARAWGKKIAEKISLVPLAQAVDLSRLKPPCDSIFSKMRFVAFVLRQRCKKSVTKPVPMVDAEKCKKCGKCVRLCPNGAISPDGQHTDPARCIKCCACVKFCPIKARTFATPYAPILSQCFSSRKSPVTIL